MSAPINTSVILAERPTAAAEARHFAIESAPCAPLEDGQVRVATEALGIDAYIRTCMNEEGFHRRVPIGGIVNALGVGVVQESRDPSLAAGTSVFGPLGAQTLATLPGKLVSPIDTSTFPASAQLGALGMSTGLTAYCGMTYVGDPQPGETVVVSAAAGAVGSMAAQVAKLAGARVIGIAGGPHKSTFLTDDLGLDGAIDYKNEDVAERLRELTPDGVSVFFDNVGNPTLDIVLDQIAQRARVVICGAIAQYNNLDDVDGPSMYLRLAERYSRMEGFTVMHFADRWDEARGQLETWLQSGEITMHETVIEGIERFPEAVMALFTGGHTGKFLLKP